MNKEFLSYTTVRNNALKLAYAIYKDDFVPDVIYVSLRGGAYLGNILSEYFKFVRKDKHPIFYAAVVARSYTGIARQEGIKIDGWTYDPEYLRAGDKVLLVDDIFDSGKTINKLVEVILQKGIPREDVRVAVHDYKVIQYLDRKMPVQPYYYCRKHIIPTKEDEIWIHYSSHELVGLSEEELEEYYFSADPELREALSIFKES
jgi:uncharacterized protein